MTIATAAAEKPQTIREKLGAKSAEVAIDHFNIMVYGPVGAGKTHLAGTADDSKETSPVLILDVEGGAMTLRRKKNIDVVPVRSIKELIEVHNKIKMEKTPHYKTVVIDTMTELHSLDMQHIMKELVERRPDLNPDVASQREWGIAREHMRRIIRAFRDLPCHTIFIAHSVEDKDDSNTIHIAPSFPGKLKTEIPGFVDIVGYLYTQTEKDQLERRLQLAKTRRIVAKDRTASLGDVIINPTIPEIWKMIHA